MPYLIRELPLIVCFASKLLRLPQSSLTAQLDQIIMARLATFGYACIFILHHLALAQDPALQSSLSSECVTFITQYPPTVSVYASQICQVCQGLSLTPSVEPCCSNSNPTACFASSFYGITVPDASSSAPITVAPGRYTGSVNCDAAISILVDCENATPGFDNLCFHDQQSCLCSTSGTWAPSFYDDYWSSCLAWAEVSSASWYSLLGPQTNGVVQSRKCQTWAAFTATGGSPSGCNTSPTNTLTSTTLASTESSGLQPAMSTGAARELEQVQVSINFSPHKHLVQSPQGQ